ncbi:unnamed protein product [Ectocarpus sp. 6 AP-2014]
MLTYPFGRPLAALCLLSLFGGGDRKSTPHVPPINSVGSCDDRFWESGLKTAPHTTYTRLLQDAGAKGGQVPDTYNLTSLGEGGRVGWVYPLRLLFPVYLFPRHTNSSAPPPVFPSKITFRRLVQALYGTTYPFRLDNATGPPRKIDPCERVAVFLFRVPGGQGVL